MKVQHFLGIVCLALGITNALSCRREEKQEILAPPPLQAALAPWSWHALGGLLVIEGEVDQPVELVLKGNTLNEQRFVELGPVRWEMYRPKKGEKAELRTRTGKLLARWDFDQPLETAAPSQESIKKVEPPRMEPKPVPAPRAPEPKKPEPKPVPAPRAPEPKKPEPKPVPAPRAPEPKKPEPKPVPAPRAPEPKKPEPKPVPAPRAPEPKKPVPKPVPAPRAPEPKKPEPKPVPAPRAPEPKKPEPKPMPVPVPASRLAPAPLPAQLGGLWPGSGEGLNLLRGPQGQRQVCLTFDGGSTSEVAFDVLDALKSRGLHCTFFLTGAFIQKFPDIVRRIDRDGHEIGNHTQNHPHLAPTGTRDPRWTKERFQQELISADLAFVSLIGRPLDPLWRAPYGEHTAELRKWAEELGYRHVGWSEGADTLDWATKKERKLYRTGNAILDRLHSRMERQDGDGLIVLMHLGSARPAEDRPGRVLGPFLDRALANGWNFVNVGNYLNASKKPAWKRDQRAALLASRVSSTSAAAQH